MYFGVEVVSLFDFDLFDVCLISVLSCWYSSGQSFVCCFVVFVTLLF